MTRARPFLRRARPSPCQDLVSGAPGQAPEQCPPHAWNPLTDTMQACTRRTTLALRRALEDTGRASPRSVVPDPRFSPACGAAALDRPGEVFVPAGSRGIDASLRISLSGERLAPRPRPAGHQLSVLPHGGGHGRGDVVHRLRGRLGLRRGRASHRARQVMATRRRWCRRSPTEIPGYRRRRAGESHRGAALGKEPPAPCHAFPLYRRLHNEASGVAAGAGTRLSRRCARSEHGAVPGSLTA